MRKRNYRLMLLAALTAATLATGWVTRPATLIGSERTEQLIAGSKGDMASAGRDPS